MHLAAMDPNLFHLDWDRSLEVLAAIVLLSMVVERALAVVFETKWYLDSFSRRDRNLKEAIAYAVSLAICVKWDFDAVSMLVLADETNWFGEAVTAGVIAGGSKGSIKLFRGWLDFKSTARRDYEAEKGGSAESVAPTPKPKKKATAKTAPPAETP